MVGSDCYIAVFGQGTMTEVDVGTDNVEVKMHAGKLLITFHDCNLRIIGILAAITKFKNAYYHTQYLDFTEDIRRMHKHPVVFGDMC